MLMMFIIIFPLATITLLIGIVLYKFFIQQKTIETLYTPLDYVTGQTSIEFHQEKEEKEENQDNGDDKYKNENK